MLVVIALLIILSCLCGCWQSCEGCLYSACTCGTTCFKASADGVTLDVRKTDRARARAEARARARGRRSDGGGEREGGECAVLVSCITCCNCCGLCGPPKGMQTAQPFASAEESGDGEVVQAVKADKAEAKATADEPTDDDGNLLSAAKGAPAAFVSVHAPLLALDRCIVRV